MSMLRIGGVAEHYNLPWHLLQESGKLENIGVELRWKDCPGGTGEMTNLLNKDQLDMAVLLTEGMVADKLKGSKTRILKVFVKSKLEWGVHVSKKDSTPLTQKNQITFAISRLGSGSHHMALLYAQQQGITSDKIVFKEVGSIDGAMDAFKNDEADAFLWERFTTEPYCDEHNLKRADSIHTPWPCFVIAVRPDYYETNRQEVSSLLVELFKQASDLKGNPSAVEIIADRYDLSEERVAHWFENVEWGNGEDLSEADVENVVNNLKGFNELEIDTSNTNQLVLDNPLSA